MFKKELQLIYRPIERLISNKLNEGFKNRQGRDLHSVENINLVNVEINEEKSNLKEIVYVKSVLVYARIWVVFHDGRANDDVQLSLNKEVILEYDFETKEYVIQNPDELALVDCTH